METLEAAPIGQAAAGEAAAVRARRMRVWCVVPWHTGAGDAEALLRDLRGLTLKAVDAGGAALALDVRVLAVDNASAERVALPMDVGRGTLGHLEGEEAGSVRFGALRLAENRGGSGGFNAGLAWALEEAGAGDEGYVWLLDSDARVAPGALAELLRVLEARRDLCAVGSAIADPESGRVFEIGGLVDRRNGELRPARAGAAGAGGVVTCDYVASCSALVRIGAVRLCPSMPDAFLHADDVVWMTRLRRRTGCGVAGVASSVVYHPRFDRFALRGRYFAARNGLAPASELGLGRVVALRRCLREVARGVQQELLGRSDLARLHVLGLRDAAAGITGRGCGLSEKLEGFRPMSELSAALKPRLGETGCWRAVVAGERALGLDDREYERLCAELGGAGVHVGSAPAKGRVWRVVPAGVRGAGLLDAAGLVLVTPGVRGGGRSPGFVVRTGDATGVAWRAVATGAAGLWQTAQVLAGWRRSGPRSAAPAAGAAPGGTEMTTGPRPTLSVVVVSFNRWKALRGSLTRVASMAELRGAEVIVVDNASSDGSAAYVEREFPGVRLIRLAKNAGVSAFNRGVEAAMGEVVLVLDDDSWPDVGAVERALRALAARPDLGAVTLHPRHPATGRSEWRHAVYAEGGRDDWPVLGCGNLVRRRAWREAGGYEEGFFLYRNDVDLALKLLEAGWGVHFNPQWTVWHDSPAAARKSERWHRVATRNWVWLAKRHGRGVGLGGMLGGVLGWAWAHRLAGWSVSRQWATARGGAEGLVRAAPVSGASVRANFRRLVRLSMGRADR